MRYLKASLLIICQFYAGLTIAQSTAQLPRYFKTMNDPKSALQFWKNTDTTTDSAAYMHKIIIGATCREYYYSQRIHAMYKIFCLYNNSDTNVRYDLVNKKDNKLLNDLLAYNCSGMRRPWGTKDPDNFADMKTVEESYNKWYKLVGEQGIFYVRLNAIAPTNYCDFYWKKQE